MSNLAREYSEAALAAMGLQTRRTVADYLMPALGMFGVGVLVGAGLGLMFAPKRGVELRGDIGRGISTTARNVGARLQRRHPDGELQADDSVGADDDVGVDDPIASRSRSGRE